MNARLSPASATTATTAPLVIARVDAYALSLPMVKPVKMSFEEVKAADNLVVRIETAAGVVGWGEAASAPTMTGETVTGMAAAVRHLAPVLQGRDAAQPAATMAAVNPYLYGNAGAKAAIEMALFDALGRATGQPLHALLGRAQRSRIPLLRMVGTGKLDADLAEAERSKAEGYVTYKIKVGIADPHTDAARTRAVCEVLGPDVLVCADANQAWSVDDAITYVQAVADTSLAFFEQPIAAADVDGMGRVARASRVPIGVDEGLHSLDDLRAHHAVGVKGCSLKTIKLGGVQPVVDAGALCATLGMHINLACKIAESGIATAAMLHLAAVVPNIDWGVSLTSQYLTEDVVTGLPALERGHYTLPQGPGLGVTIDEDRIRRHARAV